MDRRYRGPVRAVVLDWAGTAIDHGCRGPAAVFARAFERFGVSPRTDEIRAPMGMEKRAHVAAMLEMPRLADIWAEKNGSLPAQEDIDRVFGLVQELMPSTLADFAEPVPGCLDALAELRGKNVKIGSCTGYHRSMMGELLPKARALGFDPDCLVTSDEVPGGRPLPWMCWQNCMRLGIFPAEAVVKAGDTKADILEGLNAGHWSVGVVRTGNAMGMSADEIGQADPEWLKKREEEIEREFRQLGAHFVIPSIANLPEVCAEINGLLEAGERP